MNGKAINDTEIKTGNLLIYPSQFKRLESIKWIDFSFQHPIMIAIPKESKHQLLSILKLHLHKVFFQSGHCDHLPSKADSWLPEPSPQVQYLSSFKRILCKSVTFWVFWYMNMLKMNFSKAPFHILYIFDDRSDYWFANDVVWHFLIVVLESPMILIDCMPIEMPNFKASKHAYASTANGDETLLWRVNFDNSSSPLKPQTTRLGADWKFLLSNAALNWIFVLGMSSWSLWFLLIINGLLTPFALSYSSMYLCTLLAISIPVDSFLSWKYLFLEDQIINKA